METNDIKIILDSIKDFKHDMDEKFKDINKKLDGNVTAINEQALKNAVIDSKVSVLEKNNTKLWEEIDKLRDGQSDINTKIETHLSSENQEEKGKAKNFNWINLVTPLILTIGLAVIGFMIGDKK